MSIRCKLHKMVFEQHWTLGFIEQPLSDIIKNKDLKIHYIKGMPHDRWFADPFILDYDDNVIFVLAEEFSYALRRGRIAKLTIDRKSYRLLGFKIILDLPTHLSFPFIQRYGDKIYISPENSASGSWIRYEYMSCGDQLMVDRVLSNEPLTDAIVTSLLGDEYIFATCVPSQNGDTLIEYNHNCVKTRIFMFPSKIARNAGAWFDVEDKVYRPAQDCNGDYGRAVVLQEVIQDCENLVFKDIRRIESTNPKFTTGCHTFNTYRNLSVIDVHGYRRNALARFFNSIKRMISHQTK